MLRLVPSSFMRDTTSGALPMSVASNEPQCVEQGAEDSHGNSSSTNLHAFRITAHVSVTSKTVFVHLMVYMSTMISAAMYSAFLMWPLVSTDRR